MFSGVLFFGGHVAKSACKTIWNNIVNKQMYITGGIGATHSGEAFTVDYDLPNDTNYSETCASIGLMFFAQKMLKNEVDRVYADVMEQALYNTVLGGMNYEGNRFFYVNPLQVVPETCLGNTERNHVKPDRQKWFACACCPPNIARTIAGLWQYIYTADDSTAYVHLYIGGKADVKLADGTLHIQQTTEYPWQGKIVLDVKSDTSSEQTVALRIPAWSQDNYSLYVGGEKKTYETEDCGYVFIKGDYSKGVQIVLELDMEPHLMAADVRVHYDAGRAAIMRGPVVYCLEEADNGKYLNQLLLYSNTEFEEHKASDFGDSVFLIGKGVRQIHEGTERLYSRYNVREEETRITAVPYFLWNNRGSGEMQVWMRVK